MVRANWHRPPILFRTGLPVSFDAVIAMLSTTNSFPGPMAIGFAGGICVPVKLTDRGPSAGRLWALAFEMLANSAIEERTTNRWPTNMITSRHGLSQGREI